MSAGPSVSAVRLLPWTAHQAIEYLLGAFLVLAPFVLGFADTPALPVLVGAGVALLAVAVLSRGPLGIVDVLPHRAQAAIDYVLSFFLMLAPFVFGFREVGKALVVSVLAGLGFLVVSLITAYPVTAARPPRRTPPPPAAKLEL
jgi:hypothetical protein